MATTNRYTAAHLQPKGPSDARPTALQIVRDEELNRKLPGTVVLITGASAGLGIETARAIAATGATVYCAARDLKKAEKALAGIEGKIELLKLDLGDLGSVRAAAQDFLGRSGGKLNALVNNAGIMAVPSQTLTVDKFESQFGTNHLGIYVDNYNLDGEYNNWKAYGQSKTANIYMTNAIERRYGSQGLHGLAVHPGAILTDLSRFMDSSELDAVKNVPGNQKAFKSPEQGAATTVLATLSKLYDGVGGKYLEDCGEWGLADGGEIQSAAGYAVYAFDPEKEDRLWRDSCGFVGVADD